MTTDKRLKARVRARMAKTGERYTTARRHLVPGDAPLQRVAGYALRGGQHPDAAALANVLAHAGVRTPDGTPLSEAMVFGVMGGLGAGYILWEFAHDGSRVVVLGFSNRWQTIGLGVRNALDRLGIAYTEHSTGGAAGAARRFEAQLTDGGPALIWPDRYVIGYWHLPASLDGHGGHPVVAVAQRDGRVCIDDRTLAALTVDLGTAHRARTRVGSYRNTLIAPTAAAGALEQAALRRAVVDGITDCVDQLGGTSASFALPAWRKWARLMTDRRNPKGWPSVFSDRNGLAGALLSVWEATSQLGMTGGHLRDLYADFLTEAARLVGAGFDGPIAALREAARLWTQLGDTAVDPKVPEFARMRELTVAVRHAITADGDAGEGEARDAAAELWRLRSALDSDCPLGDADAAGVFARMGDTLARIFEVETAAIGDLRAWAAAID